MIFKYQEYRNFLSILSKSGPTSLFRNWDKKRNVFLLRHDVDFDIELAHSLAVIEKEEGIYSTFFILVTGSCYNPAAQKNRKMLREMNDWGFEIGLHFDPLIYGLEAQELQSAVEKEADFLSSIVGNKVRSVSLHNPSVYNQFPMFSGFVNAYDPVIFTDEFYISDSRMEFRNKDIYDFLSRIEKSTLQILLHPMHYSEAGYGYMDVMKKHVATYIDTVHENFSVNTTYQKHVGGSLRDKLLKG